MKAPSTLAVETEVVGLAKAKGWVYVYAPQLAEVDAALPKVAGSAIYQVQFFVSAAPLCAMQDAVRTYRLYWSGACSDCERSCAASVSLWNVPMPATRLLADGCSP